jgi:hypothetical protein
MNTFAFEQQTGTLFGVIKLRLGCATSLNLQSEALLATLHRSCFATTAAQYERGLE